MRDILAAETVKNLMAPLLEKAFFFEYFYEKDEGGAPVYVCRFKKGKQYIDWRERESGQEISLFVCAKEGVECALPLQETYKKEFRKFFWKHFFKKATMDERRAFIASLLLPELTKPDFFGIRL